MNGTQEAPAGAPLAAHFEAKRRIMATVKQMEERGEKLEEATPEEILEAARNAAETVFKFDFSISADGAEDADTSDKKRNRDRKRNKKRRSKKTHDEAAEKSEDTTERATDAVPMTPAPQRRNAKDANRSAPKQKEQEKMTTKSTTVKPTGSSSFLQLRKATGTESEVAKMHLRYGQGRRNLAAIKQRELRKKEADNHKEEGAAARSDFKFNFTATS